MPVALVLLLVVVLVLVAQSRAPYRRAAFLQRSGFVVMAVLVVLGGLFAAGEAFDDPGGWRAVGIVAAWAGTVALLAAVAWLWPGPAVVVLSALTLLVVVLSGWDAGGGGPGPTGGGPNDALAVFTVGAALAVLGLRRTLPAAVLLLVVGIAPMLVQALSRGDGFHGLGGSLGAASVPAVAVGALYLAAVVVGHRVEPRENGSPEPVRPRHRRRPHHA